MPAELVMPLFRSNFAFAAHIVEVDMSNSSNELRKRFRGGSTDVVCFGTGDDVDELGLVFSDWHIKRAIDIAWTHSPNAAFTNDFPADMQLQYSCKPLQGVLPSRFPSQI